MSFARRLSPAHCAWFMGLFLLLALAASLAIGPVTLHWHDWWQGVTRSDIQTQSESIIAMIRAPRVLLAALVGALLAVTGAAMQGLFRNPLADPSLIGVTAGASAGGSLVIALTASLSLGAGQLWFVSLGAFVGGMVSVWLVYQLATRANGATSVATMLLAGIAITALASSVTNLLEFVADNQLLRRISLWKMGGLDAADWPRVAVVVAMAVAVGVLLPRYPVALNALLLGESQARYLGIDVNGLKKQLIVLVAAAVGVCVAMAGTIAFVGLVVPHIVRLLTGPDHRSLLPLSALAGALLLVLSDLLARVVLLPAELPVGLVTALLGAPYFIVLLSRRFLYDG